MKPDPSNPVPSHVREAVAIHYERKDARIGRMASVWAQKARDGHTNLLVLRVWRMSARRPAAQLDLFGEDA